jgi:3-hydroxyacyl-[acyl-carrier-protein] dehydratase
VKPVIPGDQLEISVKKTKEGGVLVGFDCIVKVNGNVHAKGALTFTSIPKESLGK